MFKVVLSNHFKKDLKLARKQNRNLNLLDEVVIKLASGTHLPLKYRDHALTGSWQGYRECHVQPDWVLIYRIESRLLLLTLMRTGTHSKLFGK